MTADLEKLKTTYLVRVFDQRSYAEALQAGVLRLRSIRTYKEDASDTERGDRHEGAVMRGPGRHFTITLTPPGREPIVIRDALDICVDNPDVLDNVFLMCLYSFDQLDLVRRGVLRLPPSLRRFGSHVVFVNAYNLVARIANRCAADGIRFDHDFVRYEGDEYHGLWGVFRKNRKYAHQKEFRLAFRAIPSTTDRSVAWLELGTLEDHAVVGNVDYCTRLAHPCFVCNNGHIMGTLAPLKARRWRVQKKIDKRNGAAHEFQRCTGCRRRMYMIKVAGEWKIRSVGR